LIHIDELESIPGPGSLTWRPVRLALGIRACLGLALGLRELVSA